MQGHRPRTQCRHKWLNTLLLIKLILGAGFFANFHKVISGNFAASLLQACVLTAFDDGIGNCTNIQLDCTDGVIVTRNYIVDIIWITVGINHGNNRNTELACFLNSNIRSEEHTSELQSRFDLVCRLLLEKKKELYETYYI